MLGGILLGLLTFKPQLGVLVPVALAASGLWRCMLSAGATLCFLVVATSALFGWDIWGIFLHALPDYQILYDTIPGRCRSASCEPANGGACGIAGVVVEAVAAVLVVVLVWRVWRGGPMSQDFWQSLPVQFLVTPHAMIYDLPAVGAAIVFYAGWRLSLRVPPAVPTLVVFVLGVLLPFVLNRHMVVPLSAPILIALVVVAGSKGLPALGGSRAEPSP